MMVYKHAISTVSPARQVNLNLNLVEGKIV